MKSASSYRAIVRAALIVFAVAPTASAQGDSPAPERPAVGSPTTLGTIRTQQDELKEQFDRAEKQLLTILSRQERAIEQLTKQMEKLEGEIRAMNDPSKARAVPLELIAQPTVTPAPSTSGRP